MEENTAIQLLQMDGEVLADSRIVAKGIGVQHHNLMQTIYTYQSELEEFGQLRFETEVGYRSQGGGNPIKYAILNRNQIGVVTSLSRNTKKVVRFKVDLFKAIDAMEKELTDARATLVELRGMLHTLFQGDADALAVMKAAGLLDLPMLNSINAVLDILTEEQQAKLLPKRLDYPLAEESKEILAVLDQAGCPVTSKELATILSKDHITVIKTLINMRSRGEIRNDGDDGYLSLILQDEN